MVRLRRAEQVERNHEALLAAARSVFLARGYSGASLEAIADEAGFSKGVVYSQFGSKADLFFALLEQRIKERGAQNERIAARAVGSAGLRDLIREAARDATTEYGWAQVLVEFRAVAGRDPLLNKRYAEMHARTVRGIVAVLTQIHERAGMAPPVPLRSMAEFVLAVGSGATLERLANPDALPTEDLNLLAVRALAAPPGSESQGLNERKDETS